MESRSTHEVAASQPKASTPQLQLLTFIVADEEYGVDILRVQEIREWSKPMPLPNAPPYVRGVINIRGDIIPITDLRHRMGLAPSDRGATSAVVVLRDEIDGKSRTMGILVDAMSDVTSVPADQLSTAPSFGGGGAEALARGIATVQDKMITILDVAKLFQF